MVVQTGTKPKKKTKKKRKQQLDGDFDDFIFEPELSNDNVQQNSHNPKTSRKTAVIKGVLSLDQKNLNPDNELKKIFGSKVITASQRKKVRGKAYVKTAWLMNPKDNWHHIKKTG